MKRLWIGVLILFLLLGAGVGITVFANTLHTGISEDLKQAADAALAGDWDTAQRLTLKARGDWEAHRNITAAIADHEPMEEIDSLFSRLEVYLKTRQPIAFSSCCTSLSVFTQAIGESQAINWWSLL